MIRHSKGSGSICMSPLLQQTIWAQCLAKIIEWNGTIWGNIFVCIVLPGVTRGRHAASARLKGGHAERRTSHRSQRSARAALRRAWTTAMHDFHSRGSRDTRFHSHGIWKTRDKKKCEFLWTKANTSGRRSDMMVHLIGHCIHFVCTFNGISIMYTCVFISAFFFLLLYLCQFPHREINQRLLLPLCNV